MFAHLGFVDPPNHGYLRFVRGPDSTFGPDGISQDTIEIAREFAERFVPGFAERIDDQRDTCCLIFLAQRAVGRSDHGDKHPVAPAPPREVQEQDWRAAQAQVVRDEKEIRRRVVRRGSLDGMHSNWGWRIAVEPVPHVVWEIGIVGYITAPAF